MAYVLYGSQTSPFVRRIRMLLENTPYSMLEVDVFKEPFQNNAYSPINLVPVLEDGIHRIYDSRQIFNYLNSKHHFESLSWGQQNDLTVIESAMSALVNVLLLKRSGIENTEIMFLKRQFDRVDSALHHSRPSLNDDWNFFNMSLISFLEWASYRKLLDLEKYPEYKTFISRHEMRKIVQDTRIPEGR